MGNVWKTIGKQIVIGSFILSMPMGALPVDAANIKDMEKQSSELQKELNQMNQELVSLGIEIAESEENLEEITGLVEMKTEQLAIAKHMEVEQYQDMKLRIKYMYENGSESIFSMLFGAEGMTDFLNRVEFVRNINDYDRGKLDELNESRKIIAQEEKELRDEQHAQEELGEQLAAKKETLKAKAKETAIDVNTLNLEIEKLKKEEAERKAREEAERRAREEAERKAKEEAAKKAAEEKESEAKKEQPVSGSSYDMPQGSGVLTKRKGVNYYQGHRETYYSQRVLPGGGLNIPGRHVASDGTIRDKDGYICVASSDYPKGTVVSTSLGPGKVYDTGCAKGTIDLYTDW